MSLFRRSCCEPDHSYRAPRDTYTCPHGTTWVFERGPVRQTWRHGGAIDGMWKRVKS